MFFFFFLRNSQWEGIKRIGLKADIVECAIFDHCYYGVIGDIEALIECQWMKPAVCC